MTLLNASISDGSPKIKLALGNTPLVKAALIPWERGIPPIKFMFNPTELSFERGIQTSENAGSRTEEKKQPKVNFSYMKACRVTIGKILFDTYEEGENVVDKHIEPFIVAVKLVGTHNAPLADLSGLDARLRAIPNPLDKLSDALDNMINPPKEQKNEKQDKNEGQRPPTYRFIWGDQVHLRKCFVEKLTYKLTMFLPDGTPVRAVLDNLSLKEIDEPTPSQTLLATGIDRIKDGFKARISAQANFKAGL